MFFSACMTPIVRSVEKNGKQNTKRGPTWWRRKKQPLEESSKGWRSWKRASWSSNPRAVLCNLRPKVKVQPATTHTKKDLITENSLPGRSLDFFFFFCSWRIEEVERKKVRDERNKKSKEEPALFVLDFAQPVFGLVLLAFLWSGSFPKRDQNLNRH